MGLSYSEFDTTQQNLMADIRSVILASSDWARITGDAVILTSSASSAIGATTLTFTSTTSSGIQVGHVIAIGAPGATREYRTVTAITATVITFAGGLVYTQASGTNIYWGHEVYKATTTRGADMIVDLMADATNFTYGLFIRCWKGYTAPSSGVAGLGVDFTPRYLYWRPGVSTVTQNLHVIVSAGKEHLFIQIEGPRMGEINPSNANYGSFKNYFAICDLVPYHAGDTTPVVVAVGNVQNAVSAAIGGFNWQVHTSRNWANNGSWQPCKIMTLDYPSLDVGVGISANRQTTADGKFYLAPYVVVGDDCGFRGRLNKIYYGGSNWAYNPDNMYVPVPGTVLTYGSENYKLLGAHKNDGSGNYTYSLGPLGCAVSNGSTTMYRGPLVAIPSA